MNGQQGKEEKKKVGATNQQVATQPAKTPVQGATAQGQVLSLQQSAGNQAVSRALQPQVSVGGPVASQDFQPGFVRSAELDTIMTSLGNLRASRPVAEFHTFVANNEMLLYPVLKRYGYRGSWIKAEDTGKDFDEAYRKWQAAGETTGPAWDLPKPPARSDPWQNVWKVAAQDPLAAVWITASVLVSETLGRAFSFSADPDRLAAAAQVFSIVASAAGAAQKGSANPAVTPRAGAAAGPPRITTTPGPYPLAAGEVKSINSVESGRRKLLGTYTVGLENTKVVGLVTYDLFGNVYMEQYLAGGHQDLVWEGQIGRIPQANLPKGQFGTSEYGNAMEPLARGMVGERTGQYFREDKHPSASGPDIEPRSRIKINLLGK